MCFKIDLKHEKDKILNEYKILSRYIKPKNILNRNKTLEVQFYDESNSKIHRILRNDSSNSLIFNDSKSIRNECKYNV